MEQNGPQAEITCQLKSQAEIPQPAGAHVRQEPELLSGVSLLLLQPAELNPVAKQFSVEPHTPGLDTALSLPMT